MSISFTDDQLKVIETRDKNILVSAAAGSGKTAVLTERILDRICDQKNPASLDRLLVVTFTEAAAAEMRQRISEALDKRLASEPADSLLHRQKTLLPISQITTIDSFCLYLLRNHFQEINLDPTFRVGDNGEMKLLRKDCLDALLERECDKAEEAFYSCAECFDSDGSFRRLGEMILELYGFIQGMPFPEDWLEEEMKKIQTAEKDFSESDFMKYLNSYEQTVLTDLLEGIMEQRRVCELPGGPIQYAQALEEDCQFTERLLLADYDGRTALLSNLSFATLGRRKKDMGEEDVNLKEKVAEFRDEVFKKTIKEMQSLYHKLPLKYRYQSMEMAGNTLQELLYLTKEFATTFGEAKRDAKVIDFSDMEHLALKILLSKKEGDTYVKTGVAKAYEDFFDEIMVDEYQDINSVQEMILKSIAKEEADSGNLFMVGDVKQSIYRFRLARPEIFLEKYEDFPKNGEGKNIRIDLTKNFRSRKSVIDSVNKSFEGLMRESVGGIAYDEASHLYQGLSYEEEGERRYKTELLCLDRDELNLLEADRNATEALLVARRIKELYGNFTVYEKDGKTSRKASYRDMVILLRKATGIDNIYKEVLEAEGIPVFVVSRTGYFQAQEVKQVLNYLSILDNPRQDIPLAGAMLSYFGGFDEEELAEIRMKAGKGELLYESMERYREENPDSLLTLKIASFVEEIDFYRGRAEFLSVSELLREILEEKDFYHYVSALPGGEIRRGNMNLLIKKAESYEVTGYFGIADFVRYIEGIKKQEEDFGESNLLEETADVVRIMTIHKSKGLEFPICFLSDTGRKFNIREAGGEVMLDADLGIGCANYDLAKRRKIPTLNQSVIKLKREIDARGEDLRVLYVAMTRAREKLIITGSMKNPGKESALSRPYYMKELLTAQSFLKLLLPLALESPELFDTQIVEWNGEEANRKYATVGKGILWRELEAVPKKELFSAFSYPHKSLEGLYVKTTVSELKKSAIEEMTGEKHLFETDEVAPIIPQFLKEEHVAGNVRGSAYHRVMELMDFTLAGKSEEELAEGLDRVREECVSKQMMPAEEYDLVEMRKIQNFLATSLAKRMKEAKEKDLLYLEQPFVLSLPAKRLNKEFPEEERVLVQGVIDAYFEEEDGLVLMDYKTDRVSDEEELMERYKAQLEYYETALEQLEGKKVKEKILYSFYLEKVIPV